MTDFSKRLTTLRNANNWSKTTVAKHLNVPLSTYANYEYGIREPDIKTISKISKLYNVSTDYLLGMSNDTNNTVQNEVDLETSPILAYGGEKATKDDMDIIKAIIARHNRKKNN